MAITLGRNISALSVQRALDGATSALGRTTERLSSGQPINRARDDAAGLAISSTLGAKSRVYTQAIRNGNDAISALSIADGTYNQLSDILIRTRELATQSSNGSFSLTQRLSLDKEAHERKRRTRGVLFDVQESW